MGGCVPQAAFGRLVLVLVGLVVLLQGLHLLLLSRLDARQRRLMDPEARGGRASGPSGASGSGHVDQRMSLKETLRTSLEGGFLDATGEFRVVPRLFHGWALPPFPPSMQPHIPPSPASTPTADLTLATQTSPSHLSHLLELVLAWNGPVSVTIFVPTRGMVGEVVGAVEGMRRCWAEVRANVTVHLVVPMTRAEDGAEEDKNDEAVAEGEAATWPCDRLREWLLHKQKDGVKSYSLGVPYPVNLLRNVARRGSQSEFVMIVDVDLVPSDGLREAFLRYARSARLFHSARRGEKTVYVLPAFESRGKVPHNRRDLMEMLAAGDVRPFYQELCWKCQANTDYPRWQQEGDSGSSSSEVSPLFEVLWKDPWEPFHISRVWAPMYDERFRQYGFNRVSQACELHVAGFRFSVLGGSAFLVHRGWKTKDGFHSQKELDQERNRMLFRQFKAQLRERYPESSRRCY